MEKVGIIKKQVAERLAEADSEIQAEKEAGNINASDRDSAR